MRLPSSWLQPDSDSKVSNTFPGLVGLLPERRLLEDHSHDLPVVRRRILVGCREFAAIDSQRRLDHVLHRDTRQCSARLIQQYLPQLLEPMECLSSHVISYGASVVTEWHFHPAILFVNQQCESNKSSLILRLVSGGGTPAYKVQSQPQHCWAL